MLVTNIKWDTDGEVVDLPDKVEVPDEYNADYDGIADYLSDEYGFYVEDYYTSMTSSGWSSLPFNMIVQDNH